MITFGDNRFVNSLISEMDEMWVTKEDIDNADLVSKASNEIS